MDLTDWKSMPDSEQASRCQALSAYEEWPLFKAIEIEFMERFGSQPGVAKVYCGFASGLGYMNAVTVSIRSGQPRTKLPRTFLGFPVLKAYDRV
jgi:hypothetical protein